MTLQAPSSNIKDLTVVILAAGKGSRFGESYTKLLHPIFNKPLIYYPIQNLKNLGVTNIIAVVSDPKVEEEIKKYTDCEFVYQKGLNGTAKAVELALPYISEESELIMSLNGDDATLYSKKTLDEFLKSHEVNKAQISMMTMKTSRNMEVGRVIRDKKRGFSKILEYTEYLESGARSNEVNCGVYLINLDFAKKSLPKIQKNDSGEYYLTDLLNIAKEEKSEINLFVLKDHSQWIGINDKKDLKYAMNVIKKRNLVIKKEFPKQRVHFLGIAGSGSSACAKLAEAAGFKVSGCDLNLSGEFLELLNGVETIEGHDPSHLENVDILAVTPAVLSLDPNNSELLTAKKQGIKVLTWQEFLGKFLTRDKFVIAVAGTHGKSTTTAMVGKILTDAGFNPTIILGATASFWKGNFRIGGHLPAGRQEYLVVEADEFNDNYMSLNPDITVLTNIEFDHPEFFKDFEAYQNSFKNFLHKTTQVIIANLEDKNTVETLEEKPGTEENFFPPIIDFSKNLIDFDLKISGKHNILNASAAFNLGLNLGIKPTVIKKSLEEFPGIGRRMEYIGEINGAIIYSTFAHHPTAVKVDIEALRQKHHDREVFVFFQPHMFSRTKALFKDFVKVFRELSVNKSYILDIYPSREKDTGLINSHELVAAINKEDVVYLAEKDFDIQLINQFANSLIIIMGAGDIDQKIKAML